MGQPSVREWLDQKHAGWGTRFAGAFEVLGLETTEDVIAATDEEIADLGARLMALQNLTASLFVEAL